MFERVHISNVFVSLLCVSPMCSSVCVYSSSTLSLPLYSSLYQSASMCASVSLCLHCVYSLLWLLNRAHTQALSTLCHLQSTCKCLNVRTIFGPKVASGNQNFVTNTTAIGNDGKMGMMVRRELATAYRTNMNSVFVCHIVQINKNSFQLERAVGHTYIELQMYDFSVYVTLIIGEDR